MTYSNIGFIGCGKMASAIIKGIISSNFINPSHVIASKSSENNIKEKEIELGIKLTVDNKLVAEKSDVIVIAVKPNQVKSVLDEISDSISQEKLIVSVAAGITTSFIEKKLNSEIKVIRVMPNTPVLVNEGMSGICKGRYATDEDINYINNLLSSIGKCVIVDEAQIDIVTAISGSGPAFFYKVINDIARAGESLGLEYEKSLLLSIQTALGSAKMALNRTVSMETLISNVATKGGCTRVGVDVMEDEKIDAILEKVIKDTTSKAHELGQ
jgi:pyrroline-5-carboxylate reductase